MTFHKTRLLLLSLVAVATLTASATAQDKLRWKFKKGQKLNYVMTQKMDSSTKVMGMAIDMKMTNIMDMDWVVQTGGIVKCCVLRIFQAAASCRIPSLKERPSTTRVTFSWLRKRFHFLAAD